MQATASLAPPGDKSHGGGLHYCLIQPLRCSAAVADRPRIQESFLAAAFSQEAPMLELLEWGKKRGDGPADAESVGTALAGLGDADPSTALGELGSRLEATGGGEALALIQDAGAAHVSALFKQYFVGAARTHAAREATWKSLVNYQARLAQVLCESAGALLTAQSAARALGACRMLAKLHLVHYASVPGKLWRAAYSIHASAEKAGYATTPVHARSGDRATTTAEQELLRLLMLRVSAPDMMAPEQIEVADRVVEQLGAEFTLRQPGVADNPFSFEPEREFPPRRTKGREPSATARYFGPGMGYDSLERIARQLGAARHEEFKAFGKDIAPRVQLSAVQHLLTFWRTDCPYAPPAHSPASGTLQVVHGYGQLWQYLSQTHEGPRELSLAVAQVVAPQAPETWALQGTGGNELGAEVAPQGGNWVKCGELVGVSVGDGGERWVGMIRRMHAAPEASARADIAVLSREPQEVSLRAVIGKYDDGAFSDASSRQFAGNTVHAIILSDGAGGTQPANLLLPQAEWQEGRIYEVQSKEGARYLRGLQAVRRGEDYVRATFEWLSVPG